jgi:hypothetical protein
MLIESTPPFVKAGLERVAEIKATDTFNRATAIGWQEIQYLSAKSAVAKYETAHIFILLMLNDEKKTVSGVD